MIQYRRGVFPKGPTDMNWGSKQKKREKRLVFISSQLSLLLAVPFWRQFVSIVFAPNASVTNASIFNVFLYLPSVFNVSVFSLWFWPFRFYRPFLTFPFTSPGDDGRSIPRPAKRLHPPLFGPHKNRRPSPGCQASHRRHVRTEGANRWKKLWLRERLKRTDQPTDRWSHLNKWMTSVFSKRTLNTIQ